jgi:SAM-dependent methyltransferase
MTLQPIENWDGDQWSVISASVEARLVVDAGPGTGKTAVACARIAHLISQGIEPANVWLISFTRTAVAEVRERIRALAGEDRAAAAVRVTTLDSEAWHLRAGFDLDSRDRLFESYDENIEAVLELLHKKQQHVLDYFESVEHLVVDEAQDLVGIRAELIEAIIAVLPPSTGISVFTDDAQAIYGFSEDDEPLPEDEDSTLPERLRSDGALKFDQKRLTTVHRTNSESLRRIFVDTRMRVLDRDRDGRIRLEEVIGEITEAADGMVGNVTEQELDGRDDTLVLFRQRVEVLTASSFLRSEGVAHRIRMSGTPSVIYPWVGVLLWDATSAYLTQDEFMNRWLERVEDTPWRQFDYDEAWRLLFQAAGERGGRVELRRLRNRLARQNPPAEFSSSEVGYAGPILGTIHASKGREAPDVHLMLPDRNSRNAEDLDEECRVVFVGATRPRQNLKVGRGYRTYASRLDTGRVFKRGKPDKSPRAQVEIGRTGDVDQPSTVSRRILSLRDATAVQSYLEAQIANQPKLQIVANRDRDWRSEVISEDVDAPGPLAVMSTDFTGDLWHIAHEVASSRNGGNLRPREEIRHCYLAAVGTAVLSEDDPRVNELHEPWGLTGVYLTPVIFGFTNVYFTGYRG